MLQERLENYEGAHQDALYEKEASKVRRYDRSIKVRYSFLEFFYSLLFQNDKRNGEF
jgi:hypothetical protein